MKTKALMVIVLAAALPACTSGGNTTSQQSPEAGIMAVRPGSASAGEARVSLEALPGGSTAVTVIGELDYDASRLQVKSCELNPAVAHGNLGDKTLSFGEPQPGMLRAVVAGNLDPLPPSTDVFTCTFAVPAGTSGAVTIAAHGEVADASFVDRSFSATGTVTVGN